jgi:hypothetical protein
VLDIKAIESLPERDKARIYLECHCTISKIKNQDVAMQIGVSPQILSKYLSSRGNLKSVVKYNLFRIIGMEIPEELKEFVAFAEAVNGR